MKTVLVSKFQNNYTNLNKLVNRLVNFVLHFRDALSLKDDA